MTPEQVIALAVLFLSLVGCAVAGAGLLGLYEDWRRWERWKRER